MSFLTVVRVGPTQGKPMAVLLPVEAIGSIFPTKPSEPDGPATINLKKGWGGILQYERLEVAETVADIAAALEALGEEISVAADARQRRVPEIDGLS